MSEDHAAVAALAIERYVAGLRAELAILTPAESTELTREISAMLVDAAREDPARAFAEMDRLGMPSELAAALLRERGLAPGDGIQAASWWRMGVASFIDVFVGLALPIAVAVAYYGPAWQALFDTSQPSSSPGTRIIVLALVAGALMLSGLLAWRTWAPWRVGGRSATPGMALADVAVLRIGGTRTVVRSADLLASGLTAPTRTKVSAGITVTLAALVLLWAVWMVSGGALDPAGDAAVFRFAGPVSSQQSDVEGSAIDLYMAAMTNAEERTWPSIAENLDAAAIEASLLKRFMPGSDAGGGYGLGKITNVRAGVWTVEVTEYQADGTERPMLLTYRLRVDWQADEQPRVMWMLTGYDPSH
jgi:hypothetical protein